MLNKNPSKHNARDTFEVIAEKDEILIKKISNPLALRNTKSKMYSIRKDQVFKEPPWTKTGLDLSQTALDWGWLFPVLAIWLVTGFWPICGGKKY